MRKVLVQPVALSRRQDQYHNAADGSALPLACLLSYVKYYDSGKLLQFFEVAQLQEIQSKDWQSHYGGIADEYDQVVWLFSCYMWNIEDNLHVAKMLKALNPNCLMIFGGPHVPKYEQECTDFFTHNRFVDVAVRAEGEITLAKVLEQIAISGRLDVDLSEVEGITYRKPDNSIYRTVDRERNRDLSLYPSPFLTGEFDHECFESHPVFVLETNRGCPFGCTFCDWGAATLQKVSHFPLDTIKQEILFIAKKRGHTVYIADANFGAFQRDVEIARALVDAKTKYGFPKGFACNYAKHPSAKIAEIVKILTEGGLIATGIISMQSTDEDTLQAIHRSNIKTHKYSQMIDIFREEGLKLSSELLIGLPGQTYSSYMEDLQFFIDRKLLTITYITQMMPNAPMNDPAYKKLHSLEVDQDGFIVSTGTCSKADLDRMVELFAAFQLLYVLGLLKYYLYFIQVEHNVRVIDFIHKILNLDASHKAKFPIIFELRQKLLGFIDPKRKGMPMLKWETPEVVFLFDHLDDFYNEVNQFILDVLLIKLSDEEMQTLKIAQKAVMPELGKKFPLEVNLPHDLPAYIKQLKVVSNVQELSSDFKPLASFQSGKLKVTAAKRKIIDALKLDRQNNHDNAGWELRSALRFY